VAAVPIAFSRSVRSIEADGHQRPGLALATALIVVMAWGSWFFLASVSVVEVGQNGRLEVDQAAHGVEAPVAGKVTWLDLTLGREVAAGDVVAELDAEDLKLELSAAKTREAATGPQIAALEQEIAQEEALHGEHRRITQIKIAEALARRREAETATDFAENENGRAARLNAEGLAAGAEVLKSKAEYEQKRSALDSVRLAAGRIEAEQRASEIERRAKIAGLRKDVAQLEGLQASSAAAIRELEHRIERRRLRAPIAGRIGEIAAARVGSVVKEGERLAAIVPAGNIRVIAEYPPASAVGRIRPGQRACMRAEGFTWTEYGMLHATVRRVASEPRSGRIRVELEIDEGTGSRIPLQHGLPGTLEIEVERVSPATLVLRAAGRRLSLPVANENPNANPSANPNTSGAR
jgi:multidrug resistance efflux pump